MKTMVKRVAAAMGLIGASSACDASQVMNSSQATSVLTAEPENVPLMNLEVNVPTSQIDSFVAALLAFGRHHSFQSRVNRTPKLGEDSRVGGITSVRLTRGPDKIAAINPFFRDRFVISVSSRREEQEARLAVQALAIHLETMLDNIRVGQVSAWEQHFMK